MLPGTDRRSGAARALVDFQENRAASPVIEAFSIASFKFQHRAH